MRSRAHLHRQAAVAGLSRRRCGPVSRIARGRWWSVVLAAVLAIAGCTGDGLRGPGGWDSSITECIDPARSSSGDIRRNLAAIRKAPLCYRRQEVREGGFRWVFHILEHRKAEKGPFWVLPHDNEDTAFDVALDAVLAYGGGLLAVDAGGRRQFQGQDPNRNFSSTGAEARVCIAQRTPAPGYTASILAHYQGRRGPYLAMHNNHDGWSGNGGRGSISIHKTSSVLYGFPSAAASGQLRDEDNLVIIAGLRSPGADAETRRRIAALNAAGLNVLYKEVTERSFDCSMSDYVARHRLGDYYNIEAEYGQREAQTEMVQRLMDTLGVKPLRRAAPNPFLR